jgi:NADP-dependent 3-hydroxy acid dehydrogenase YdfG
MNPDGNSSHPNRKGNNMPQLKNEIAGGSSGIGLAAAKMFVEEGAYVFIASRRRRAANDRATISQLCSS